METGVEALVEKDAVIETVTRLFVATDRRDWDAVRGCLAEEVLFDMSSMGAGTPEKRTARAIAESWEVGLRDLQAIHHQAGNFLVRIEGNRATAFCYGIASHYLENPTGRNTRTFVGSYDFALEKLGLEWRIDAFRFQLKYQDGNRELEASR